MLNVVSTFQSYNIFVECLRCCRRRRYCVNWSRGRSNSRHSDASIGSHLSTQVHPVASAASLTTRFQFL